ncbi:hypothetical protein ACFY7C_00905 [Streptomyces sp. NPDC012769]|uniref:hypothetical protein n=1 Tax=Streptomyces sp. NPDC012769 TaxID=3364848 RepID=UPI00367E1ED2
MKSHQLMRRATALLASAVAVVAFSAMEAQATVAETSHGCPSGAFCIYPENAGWNDDRPSHIFWSGPYNLHNQVGKHIVFNNQTDGWVVDLCVGYNGTDCRWYMLDGAVSNLDLTMINSVVLRPR